MKKTMNQWKEAAIRLLPAWVLIFCILQPLLDVAAYWQETLEYKSILTTLLRMSTLVVTALLGFWLSDRKRIYFAAAGVMGVFLVLRSAALMQAGYTFPIEDLRNLIQLYTLPVYTISLCTLLKKNGRSVKAAFWGMGIDFGIVALVMLMSWATGTDPHTYMSQKLGIRGWFLLGNAPSAILSMLVPMAIGWTLHQWPNRVTPVAVVAIAGELALYAMATRLSSASILAVGIGIAVSLLIIDRRKWRQATALMTITAIFTALLMVSPMAVNQKSVEESFNRNQHQFDQAASLKEDPKDPGDPEEEKPQKDPKQALLDGYRLYVPGIITRFGGDRTLEAYNYTTDVNKICSRRTMRLTYCRLLQEDSPASAKWFGMDITRMKVEGVDLNWSTGMREHMITSFDPENDFHAVYYLYGGVGLALMIAFFAFFAGRGIWAMIRDFKTYFTPEFAAVACACCTDLAHCIFTSSTLRRINTQAYLAVLLALLWRLSRKELSARRMKQDQ